MQIQRAIGDKRARGGMYGPAADTAMAVVAATATASAAVLQHRHT